jgi:pimeloyl-ACP methyl ester carboxylesterase
MAVLTCWLGVGCHEAAAGPIRQANAQAAYSQPQTHAGSAAAAAVAPAASEPTPVAPRAHVYIFRGALGPLFSTGMDRLAEKIVRAGIPARAYEFTLCPFIASMAIDKYRQDPAPIVLIGHSMGGRCALEFSEKLQDAGIPVSLVVTIDPAHMSPDVPANVERYINIFLSKSVLGGGDIKPVAGFPGHYASYDVQKHDEISHITIDKVDAIHQQLVTKILQISATPSKTDDEILPLRYAVPANADIELWDSGMAVTARPGDTLQTLALQYHLPLWSLTQVNPMPDDMPLVPGERITVPRHLEPSLTTAAASASSGR